MGRTVQVQGIMALSQAASPYPKGPPFGDSALKRQAHVPGDMYVEHVIMIEGDVKVID